MNIKKIVPNINNYIKDGTDYIAPTEKSHVGQIVPELIFKYGSISSKVKSLPRIGRYLIGSIRQIVRSYKAINNQPTMAKKSISNDDIADMNALLNNLNINAVGYTEVDPAYIFKDKKILFKNAIVLIMEMKNDIIKTAPSYLAEKEIFRTYYELGVAVNKVSEFLKRRDYKAHAGPALGGDVNYPLLAQKAGLGQIGKHGLLITPQFGPSIRIATVYTDIENLPTSDNNMHTWVREFCDSCNKCVRKCPAQAIYMETKIFDDGTRQHIDYKKCAVPFSNQNGCTVCVKECSFFCQEYDKIKAKFEK